MYIHIWNNLNLFEKYINRQWNTLKYVHIFRYKLWSETIVWSKIELSVYGHFYPYLTISQLCIDPHEIGQLHKWIEIIRKTNDVKFTTKSIQSWSLCKFTVCKKIVGISIVPKYIYRIYNPDFPMYSVICVFYVSVREKGGRSGCACLCRPLVHLPTTTL